MDPREDAQVLIKRKDLKRQVAELGGTPVGRTNKGMASPAVVSDSSTSASTKKSGETARRSLFTEPAENQPPQGKQPAKQPKKSKKTPDEADREKQDNETKAKPATEESVGPKTSPKPKPAPKAKAKVGPKVSAAKSKAKSVRQKGSTTEVPSQPAETAPKATAPSSSVPPKEVRGKIKVQKAESSASLGAVVKDALNRSGTAASIAPTQSDESESDDEGRASMKAKRDLVLHARKMRFYRSLSSHTLRTCGPTLSKRNFLLWRFQLHP